MVLSRLRVPVVVVSLSLAFVACSEDDPGGGDGVGGTGGVGGIGGDGGTGGRGGNPSTAVDLAADVDRDGVVSPGTAGDEEGEESWDAGHGAIFLPNLDDDDDNGRVDALEPGVSGAADLADLSFLVVAPCEVPDGAIGVVSLDAASEGAARLFRIDGPADDPASYAVAGLQVTLDAAQLRAGATLALEGTTPVLSRADGEWTGFVDALLQVTDAQGVIGEDRVRLRVAPLLFQYNTAPTERVFYSDSGAYSDPLVAGLEPALAARDLEPIGLTIPGGMDPWTQDFFDVAYVSKPGPGGEPVGMHVAIRSAQPDRAAGQIVTRYFLGPDFGSLYVHQPGGSDPYTDGYSMNSFGNWDVIPPHETASAVYPLGRNVFGAGSSSDERPDPDYVEFVHAQAVQPALELDTSWLLVGHVDEFVQWVADPGPRGFRTLIGHPAGAREMLLEMQAAGHGDVPMFVGKYLYDYESEREYLAEVTVSEVLADADRMAASQRSQTIIDEEVGRLVTAVQLADEDLTTMPFLFEELWGGMLAYQPGTVNLLHVDGVLVIADPFGPTIDGEDPFKADLEARLGAYGLEVYFADNWDLYHAAMGEVHCGTNVVRTMNQRWWESGR